MNFWRGGIWPRWSCFHCCDQDSKEQLAPGFGSALHPRCLPSTRCRHRGAWHCRPGIRPPICRLAAPTLAGLGLEPPRSNGWQAPPSWTEETSPCSETLAPLLPLSELLASPIACSRTPVTPDVASSTNYWNDASRNAAKRNRATTTKRKSPDASSQLASFQQPVVYPQFPSSPLLPPKPNDNPSFSRAQKETQLHSPENETWAHRVYPRLQLPRQQLHFPESILSKKKTRRRRDFSLEPSSKIHCQSSTKNASSWRSWRPKKSRTQNQIR